METDEPSVAGLDGLIQEPLQEPPQDSKKEEEPPKAGE